MYNTSFNKNSQQVLAFNYFRKKLHHKQSTFEKLYD